MPSPWPTPPASAEHQESEPSGVTIPVVGSRSWRVRGLALSYVVLTFGLGITTLISVTFVRSVREREALRIQSQATEIENHIRSRLSRNVASLLGGAALFAMNSRVSRSEFGDFTERLMRLGGLSGMQGLGFVRRVAPDDLRAYEYAVRREIPGFRVWPQSQRDERYAVEFIEPQNWRNARVVGYDMASDPVRLNAMERARDTGEPATSGRVTLVQETQTGTQSGFVIYAPAYRHGRLPTSLEGRRQNLVGFVYSPYRGKDFLDLALTESDREQFAVSLYAGDTCDAANAIYQAPAKPGAPIVATKTFNVTGGRFTLQLKAQPTTLNPSRWAGVVIGILLGVLVSVLMFTIMRFQVAARMVAERNSDRLRQARSEALRNLRTRDAFLSIASHELKTPLTALQLQVDGLHRAFASNLPMEPDRVQRRLDSVRRQTRRLATLVDDLLDVSRLANGRLQLVPEETSLGALIREILLRFEAESQRQASPIRLHLEDTELIGHWDSSRLDQVITNLLSNALKYGAGQPIDISARRRDDCVVIEVKDRGIGIAAADQQRIFSRFERAVPDRNFGGFGLGLWICREIVGAMGGSITLTSEAGRGATFEVTLPLQDPIANTAVAS